MVARRGMWVIGIVLAALWVGCVPGPPELEVQIYEPRPGGEVGREVIVRGLHTESPSEGEICVFVYSHQTKKYYPQGAARAVAIGLWQCRATIGGPEDEGLEFDIHAFVVDKKAQQVVDRYLGSAIEQIPDGATSYHHVTVKREMLGPTPTAPA